jgi:hypothetical protein
MNKARTVGIQELTAAKAIKQSHNAVGRPH